MDKPLPSLPSESSSADNAQTPGLEYEFRVKAKWERIVNSDYVGDLSFAKDEILDVLSTSNFRWWKARNQAGEIGTVPSNYLIEKLPDYLVAKVMGRAISPVFLAAV